MPTEIESPRMDGIEAAKRLKICPRTLLKRRKDGKIAYLEDGGKIFYLKRHLDEYNANCDRAVSLSAPVAPVQTGPAVAT
jgi:hypothetical protein